jgi:hypothetical protein
MYENRDEIVKDIVTRLREYNPVRGFIDWDDTMRTAADEIERLQFDLSELKFEYQKLWEKYNRRENNG